MLDIKYIVENKKEVEESLKKRAASVNLEFAVNLYEDVKKAKQEFETLQNKRKTLSKEIGALRSRGEDASSIMNEVSGLSDEVKKLENAYKEKENELNDFMLGVPNILHKSVPEGKDDTANKEIKKWGEIKRTDFKPKPHWELGEKLDIIDTERAAKISKSRFCIYKGMGAALERALLNFMLDTHTKKHGYKEIFPPVLVNSKTMTGTGQLPKFKDDLFKLEKEDLWLIPTAEVPLTNLFADEILKEADLPVYLTAYTPCFRSEAGSYGKDTRGIIRQHQFNKVELVKFSHPDKSEEELEKLLSDAEKILQMLEMPYRVVVLSSGDTGFSASKTYDIEVWLPSQNKYREISSCSTFTDFQARRANIKFKGKDGGKPQFVHTLNGSGLAVGRTWIAVVENYQREDGSIEIPAALKKYME